MNVYVIHLYLGLLRTLLDNAYSKTHQLENTSTELPIIFNQARARLVSMAQKNSESYSTPPPFINAAPGETNQHQPDKPGQTEKCYFCGNSRHPRIKCPAKDINCNICGKNGHVAKVCQSKPQQTAASMHFPFLATTTTGPAPYSLRKSIQYLIINEHKISTLIDSGSSESFNKWKSRILFYYF